MIATMNVFSRQGRRDERGAAAVEFAIVLPVLLLLVFGIIEFGLLFNRFITITHAAREGVRVTALTGGAIDPLTGEAKGEAAGEASAPDIVSGVDCVEVISGGEATMTCTTTYDFALFVVTSPMTLSSTAKMTIE